MNTKLLAGSLLSGLSLLAAVLNAWAQHFFFAAFHIARAEALEGAGNFNPGPYGVTPESTQIFLGIRILLWLLLLAGIGLLAWGAWDETRQGG